MATTREITNALRRQRALSGESLDPNVAESIVRAGLQDDSERALRSRGIALQERAFEQGVKERERERKTQNLAGTIGAGVKIGGMFAKHGLDKRALEISATRAATEKTFFESRLFFHPAYRGNMVKSPVHFHIGLVQFRAHRQVDLCSFAQEAARLP